MIVGEKLLLCILIFGGCSRIFQGPTAKFALIQALSRILMPCWNPVECYELQISWCQWFDHRTRSQASPGSGTRASLLLVSQEQGHQAESRVKVNTAGAKALPKDLKTNQVNFYCSFRREIVSYSVSHLLLRQLSQSSLVGKLGDHSSQLLPSAL